MGTTAEQDPLVAVRKAVADLRGMWAKATEPDGPFPLAEEEVAHFGTIQKYRCWQKGPNSLVYLTLPEMYGECFTRFIDREFLVYEGERYTYGHIISEAAALAAELQANYGIKRGDCIAVAGRNTPEWVISFIAGTRFLGAVVLPVNSWWMGEELRYGLMDSKAVLLLADDFVLQRAPFLEEMKVKSICMRGAAGAPARPFGEVLAAGRGLPPPAALAVQPDDVGMLMYTSGTTNKPKGVVMTHRSIMAAMNCFRLLNLSTDQKTPPTIMVGSPLFHVNGSHVALIAAILQGAKLVMMYKWDAGKALELVQREKIVSLVGVPTMTYEMVNHPDFNKYDTTSLVGVGGGGAAFAAPMIKRVADKFKNARAGTGYGLTETNAASVFMPAPFFPAKPTSCGMPLPNVEVSILGEDGKFLPVGDVGEICIRGATIMKEYWGKPDKTAEVFHLDAEGKLWFKSGDIGALDSDGFVYIMDRAKDIIIRGGENISCAEVEGALFEHPSVAEVAAIGVPDETLGEKVAVAVVFKQGEAPPSGEDLRRHAASRLAPFKVPAEYVTWTEGALPRGATGKIQKRDIRERLKASRGAPASKL